MTKNREIAEIFYRIADVLELKGAIVFKIRAYRNAASTIESLNRDIETIYSQGTLEDIKGIGKAIAGKIGEYLETGTLAFIVDLEKDIPPELLKMLDIPGLGPRKIMALHKHLGVETIEELEKAAEEGRIEDLDGFGKTSQENVLKGIKVFSTSRGRMLLGEASTKADDYLEYLREKCKENIFRVSVTGSLRRMCETIGDIDILVAPKEDNGGPPVIVHNIMEEFVNYPRVIEILARGDTKSSVRFRDNTQVDLRVISRESWGAALQYFTGSRDHNITVRKIAIEKDLKINEYGVYRRETEERIAGDDEREVYRSLGMAWVPPETREDRGEVELALKSELPELVEQSDIRGDLHIHTESSDGSMTLSEIVELAVERDYEYIGIADHSKSLTVAHGLGSDELLANIESIKEVQDSHSDITLFAGSEVDILKSGELDYPPDILEELDLVIGSVHSSFSIGEKEMTERIVDAMSTGHMNILAHPTGRKIGKREPYDVDIIRVMDAALDNDVALEINSIPIRLDLNMENVLLAEEKGVLLSINTDAHKPHHLDVVRAAFARREQKEPAG